MLKNKIITEISIKVMINVKNRIRNKHKEDRAGPI